MRFFAIILANTCMNLKARGKGNNEYLKEAGHLLNSHIHSKQMNQLYISM